MANRDLQYEVEQLLYKEARLLDDGLFYEWLDLFTDDVKYWMPTRDTRERGEDGVHREGEMAVFSDDKDFLVKRVQRFDTGLAHAEQPHSRTRHFLSNVEIVGGDENEIDVRSNILVYQVRLEKSENFFVGRREDRLRKVNGDWRIARRKIVLDQTLIPRSLSIFF